MSTLDRLRLTTRVARLYHEHGLKQSEIARQLSITQAMVSRLLASAEKEGIVRTTVTTPAGVYSELEEGLVERYGLKDAVVADCSSDTPDEVLRAIGGAAAGYLETTLGTNEVVGISSWSETLLRTVSAMQPRRAADQSRVVQVLGGIGTPAAEVHAIRLTQQLASLLKADPVFLTAPGVAASPEAAAAYMTEPHVQEAMRAFDSLTVALVGVGSLHPSRLLGESGNVFSKEELAELRHLGAVGDICVHFFDEYGKDVQSPLTDRVIGMSLDQLRRVPRTIGVAGTSAKTSAIRGALRGRLISALVTDRYTAERLLSTEVAPRG